MFINITIDLAVRICAFAIPVFVLLYFAIFRKYNSRNNIAWNDIIFDAIEFITNSVIHLLIFIIGLDYMIEGLHLLDAVYERYANFIVGVGIISVVIYHYIYFIKRLLVDLDPEVIKKEKETNYKFGEYVLFIFLCLLLINPILSLPKFAMHIGFKDLLIKEVLMSLGCSIVAIFLLYHINPLNIRYVNKEERDNKKEKNNVKEELLNNVNEKVEFEDTGYDDLNMIGDKVEDIMNESTLNAPKKEKIVIPDEAELKPKKKTNKSSSSKKTATKNSSSKSKITSVKKQSTKKKSTKKTDKK